jgi:hypothetical protein
MLDSQLNPVEMGQTMLIDPYRDSFALEEVVAGTNRLRIEFQHVAVLGAAILAAIVDDPEP